MNRQNDLMARVAEANPIPAVTASTREENREAELLLARLLDTPLPQAQRHARRPKLTRGRGLALAGAVAGMLVAILVTLSALDRGPGVAERAYAAVTADRFFHVVQRSSLDLPVDLADGDPAHQDGITESWYDTSARAFHTVAYGVRHGRRTALIFEAAGNRGGTRARFGGGPAGPVSDVQDGQPEIPSRYDPAADYKRALKSGHVREEGETTFAGRRAKRLVVALPDQKVSGPTPAVVDQIETYYVDPDTLYPIAYRARGFFVQDGRRERFGSSVDFTAFEILPRNAANQRLLRLGTRP
jgi:hypothetical protein